MKKLVILNSGKSVEQIAKGRANCKPGTPAMD